MSIPSDLTGIDQWAQELMVCSLWVLTYMRAMMIAGSQLQLTSLTYNYTVKKKALGVLGLRSVTAQGVLWAYGNTQGC